MRRRRPKRLKHKRVKMIAWSDIDPYVAGFWFDHRVQALRIAGPLRSKQFGELLLDLGRSLARAVRARNADGRARFELVGGNRWRLSLRLPKCRGIVLLMEAAIREGRLPGVRVRGPVRGFYRLCY